MRKKYLVIFIILKTPEIHNSNDNIKKICKNKKKRAVTHTTANHHYVLNTPTYKKSVQLITITSIPHTGVSI